MERARIKLKPDFLNFPVLKYLMIPGYFKPVKKIRFEKVSTLMFLSFNIFTFCDLLKNLDQTVSLAEGQTIVYIAY